jgi:hypothetical protein
LIRRVGRSGSGLLLAQGLLTSASGRSPLVGLCICVCVCWLLAFCMDVVHGAWCIHASYMHGAWLWGSLCQPYQREPHTRRGRTLRKRTPREQCSVPRRISRPGHERCALCPRFHCMADDALQPPLSYQPAVCVAGTPGRRRWGDDDDSDDDELTIDSVRRARAAKSAAGDDQSLAQIQAKTSETSRQALSSTQRAMKQLEQTTQMAGATMERIHDQVPRRVSACRLPQAPFPPSCAWCAVARDVADLSASSPSLVTERSVGSNRRRFRRGAASPQSLLPAYLRESNTALRAAP